MTFGRVMLFLFGILAGVVLSLLWGPKPPSPTPHAETMISVPVDSRDYRLIDAFSGKVLGGFGFGTDASSVLFCASCKGKTMRWLLGCYFGSKRIYLQIVRRRTRDEAIKHFLSIDIENDLPPAGNTPALS